MKPFAYFVILVIFVSCNSISPLCYTGPFQKAQKNKFSRETPLMVTEDEQKQYLNYIRKEYNLGYQLSKTKSLIHRNTLFSFPRTSEDKTTVGVIPIWCRIVFLLNCSGDVYNLNKVWTPNIKAYLDELTPKNIDSIVLFRNDTIKALYGEYGNCGLVLLYSNSKKLKRKLKKLAK